MVDAPAFDPTQPFDSASVPAFDPTKPSESVSTAPPFDPSKPHEVATGEGNMFTDVWPEMKAAATSAAGTIADTLNPFSEARHKQYAKTAAEPTFMGGLGDVAKQTLDTGAGLAEIPAAPVSTLVNAPLRSLVGHPMATAEHAIGTLIAPETAAKDNPQEMYETAKSNVDTALSAIRPKGTPVKALASPGYTPGPYEIAPTTPSWEFPAKPQPPTPTALA